MTDPDLGLQLSFEDAANFPFESGWLWPELCAEAHLPDIACPFCDPTHHSTVYLALQRVKMVIFVGSDTEEAPS